MGAERTFPAMTELVPHGLPMLALDELLDWKPGHARARLVVSADSLFSRDGKIETTVALEYMAQTVAACLGMESRTGGTGVRVGMVIACRQMTIERPYLVVGEELVLEANMVHGSDYSSSFKTETRGADGELVAKATMMLVHGEKPPE
ncbi:MAG: putative hotdog family 3-hydroxylacyl-ACP dehydratase [Planctomycetota bacterium]|jgi:predicted hotdog family 3-hydroxylacyl-ACP dehydratase